MRQYDKHNLILSKNGGQLVTRETVYTGLYVFLILLVIYNFIEMLKIKNESNSGHFCDISSHGVVTEFTHTHESYHFMNSSSCLFPSSIYHGV